MAEIKDLDQRFNTKGAGTIRIETSVEVRTGLVTKYSLAYVNLNINNSDNGRVVGFDNSHVSQDLSRNITAIGSVESLRTKVSCRLKKPRKDFSASCSD